MNSKIFVRLPTSDKLRLERIARKRRTSLSTIIRELIVTLIQAA